MSGILDFLADVAPTLSKVVVSAVPGGQIALMGVTALAKAFGVGVADVPAFLNEADQKDPEFRLKIIEAERLVKLDLMGFQRDMQSLGLQEYQTQTADLADVRRMIVENHDRTPAILAFASLGGYVCLAIGQLIMMSKGWVPTDPNMAMLMGQIMGDLRGYVSQTLAVFCGAVPPSQIGSKRQ